ncbi:Phosphatidylserine/phosphatidylglycerophosphate/cardiolipin synthase [Maridesulfovibrio ferrireducens]|uniref:Phosphatidylserine/phosphatidylglycerophosphate/cardiolipin synthase n=1 Tax=Maridesulfovibrio ferrireducens TaxID=246191 RepID=A0A1G9LRT9_9BACT|nr:phospholipase D-like domain-containing protein [Maridesulfovibrio ferrireducens]SDL64623.1 Phosphatidylserine/phosphatidylglycerophosphate/cardiolipin synthase [Maridesulfovibrio ferrireducens]
MPNIFEKDCVKVVYRTGLELPPVWIGRDIDSSVQEGFGSVFVSGKKRIFAAELERRISGAQQGIVLCSFLLADQKIEDALYEAAQRGVRVYIMLACETRLDKEEPDDEFGQMCLKQHKAMLKLFSGKAFIRSAPFFHAKIVLIDALSEVGEDSYGALLTANVTREALERNEEIMIPLNADEIREAVNILRWALFETAEHEVDGGAKFTSIQPLEELKYPGVLKNICCTSKNETGIFERALAVIESSRRELIVSSFGWDADHSIVEAICRKAEEGVKITVLARLRPSAMDALVRLENAGVEVLGFKWLHAKAVWSDSGEAVVMSANLQKHGMDDGFELGVGLSGQRASDLFDSLSSWKKNAPWQFQQGVKLGDVSGRIKIWEAGKLLDEIIVVKSGTVNLPDVKAKCVTRLGVDIVPPEKGVMELPFHEVKYLWKVTAPKLPTKSNEIFLKDTITEKNSRTLKDKGKGKDTKRSYDPKVYRLPSGEKVIAISRAEDLNKALKLKERAEFNKANIVAAN